MSKFLSLFIPCLPSFMVNQMCFLMKKTNKQWLTREFLYFLFFYYLLTLSACLPEDQQMCMGSLHTSIPPNSIWGWPWKPARLHCYPLSITNVPDTQSIGEEVQLLEATQEICPMSSLTCQRPLENQMHKRGMINCSSPIMQMSRNSKDGKKLGEREFQRNHFCS